MAIVVEDGSGSNPAAYAFVTQNEVIAYALARGIELEAGAELDVQIVKSTDFIVSKETDFAGSRTNDTQPLPFPRTDLAIYDVDVPVDAIPLQVKNLQCGLVMAMVAGFDFFPATSEAGLRRKKTGPLEKEWFAPGGGVSSISHPTVDALLAPLLSDQSGWPLRVVRV